MGETVVVTGATGGVGIHLVQVARAAGARVIAVTGSASKLAVLREAGSDEVVVTGGEPFEAEVRRLTGGSGADVVLDNVGPPLYRSCLRSLRTTGRMVAVGNVEPREVPANLGQFIWREFELIGTARPGREELLESIGLVASGRVRPWVDRTFPLEEAPAAHALMEERGAVGRCVLVFD
jgi:NADPH:quinone reductase-like Zn-dependent oxidoreductase